jgi:hypothetical protein
MTWKYLRVFYQQQKMSKGVFSKKMFKGMFS